mgnify:CR=1 FL=1
MKRYGHESRHDRTLNLDFWLIVARGTNGSNRPSLRINADYPNLARNERAINLKVTLPVALFELPTLTAQINVEHPRQAVTVDASAIAEAVRGAIGMDVDVSVVKPEASQ